MKIMTLSETQTTNNPHGVDARMLYDRETAQAIHIRLNPGQSLKPHITPVDVFFFIIEGTPDILVGEEKQRVTANTIVESPKDVVHCIYNNTDRVARILVVKAPKPVTQTKIL